MRYVPQLEINASVARNVDDRGDGNELKFVTRSPVTSRSGVVERGTL